MVGRRGKKKALIAVGHKILIAAYHILNDKTEYKELGAGFLETKKQKKQITHYLQKLKELGVDIEEIQKQAECRPVA